MAQVIPPGFAHVVVPIRHANLARSAAITYGIELESGATPSPSIPNFQLSAFMSAWTSFVDQQVTVGPVVCVFGQDGAENLSIEGTSQATGTAASDRVWANTALLIAKGTLTGGRKGRGRVFIPWCLAETVVSEVGVIDPASVVSAQTAADNWLANIAGAASTVGMVVLHDSTAPPPHDPSPVVSLTVRSLIGTQRRRLGR